ncbi:MAG: hypothetical protein M1814_004624 [Vezdaea aestivalis]|nr:MAG: hypothetical protein M1814_004624 [Vezdaea aestivalis]
MATPWTCRRCANLFSYSFHPFRRRFQTLTPRPLLLKNRALLVPAAIGTALGAGTYALSDDLSYVSAATVRTNRVVSTLGICVNDYRKTTKNRPADDEEYGQLLKACHQRCADRTLKVLEKNGSVFIKLGQHLSSMGYLLPLEWTTTFVPLQDKCPVSSYESIEQMFIDDTGHPISSLFSSFERTPIGAASLAQVHKATLLNGQDVAVKVQHPSLQVWASLDLRLTSFTFNALKYFFPDYDLSWLSQEMSLSLPQELDFQTEGQNALRAREYFSHVDEPALIIPDVIWALPRILVMDFVSGHRPDDLEYLDAHGIDRDEVSATLSRIFNEMIFGTNAPLHCDPHGGNIAVRHNPNRRSPNFDVVLFDHGLYRYPETKLRRAYARLWLAVLDADETRMRKYAKEVAGVEDADFPLFASAITGRDFRVVMGQDRDSDESVISGGIGISGGKGVAAQPRSGAEKEEISAALGEGMLQQLVEMLGKVPRIILLILKTNDLTRSLDENLQTRLGPVRTFLILARYCSRTVFLEEVEGIRGGEDGDKRGRLWWPPKHLARFVGAWWTYMRVVIRLEVYEYLLSAKRAVGLL